MARSAPSERASNNTMQCLSYHITCWIPCETHGTAVRQSSTPALSTPGRGPTTLPIPRARRRSAALPSTDTAQAPEIPAPSHLLHPLRPPPQSGRCSEAETSPPCPARSRTTARRASSRSTRLREDCTSWIHRPPLAARPLLWSGGRGPMDSGGWSLSGGRCGSACPAFGPGSALGWARDATSCHTCTSQRGSTPPPSEPPRCT
mmetsp:Transcript_35929/g.86730  ORF Transcript_35929/g.86730 Transcript_35929/m.86730 type:complete len:204 (-) Transcript_35929:470-1081(-)